MTESIKNHQAKPKSSEEERLQNPLNPKELNYERVQGWGSALPSKDIAGVGVDSQMRVYVFMRGNENPIVILNSDGNFIASWGKGMFHRAHALFIAADDSIYCVDDAGHSVRRFSEDGRLLLEINTADQPADTGYVTGQPGLVLRSGPPFNTPTGVAISPEGHIIVSDGYGNARIHRFTANGTLIHSFGEPGHGPGQFYLPHGVAVDCDGRIYVADRENHRVQVFDPGGEFIAQWTAPRASSIAIDGQQRLFVTEMGTVIQGQVGKKHIKPENDHPKITVRNRRGEILDELLPGDPDGDGLFFSPHSIAVDAFGSVYVSEVSSSYSGGLAPSDRQRLHKYTRNH